MLLMNFFSNDITETVNRNTDIKWYLKYDDNDVPYYE